MFICDRISLRVKEADPRRRGWGRQLMVSGLELFDCWLLALIDIVTCVDVDVCCEGVRRRCCCGDVSSDGDRR